MTSAYPLLPPSDDRMVSDGRPSPDEVVEITAYTVRGDGTILFHRGDTSDLEARTWVCPEGYRQQCRTNWLRMAPLYDAALGKGAVPVTGLQMAAYAAFDELSARLGGLPTTAQVVDACCDLAEVTLVPIERLLHIRLVKERHAIAIGPFDELLPAPADPPGD